MAQLKRSTSSAFDLRSSPRRGSAAEVDRLRAIPGSILQTTEELLNEKAKIDFLVHHPPSNQREMTTTLERAQKLLDSPQRFVAFVEIGSQKVKSEPCLTHQEAVEKATLIILTAHLQSQSPRSMSVSPRIETE